MLTVVEPVKVILKFSIQKIFEMYYYSEMELPEIILLAEASSHTIYNKNVFASLPQKGLTLFNQKWLHNKALIQDVVKNSEKRRYYNDSVIGIIDLMEKLDNKIFKNTNSKLLFCIITVLTKINEL